MTPFQRSLEVPFFSLDQVKPIGSGGGRTPACGLKSEQWNKTDGSRPGAVFCPLGDLRVYQCTRHPQPDLFSTRRVLDPGGPLAQLSRGCGYGPSLPEHE